VTAVGVDGYRDGWVAAAVDGRRVTWLVTRSIEAVVARWPGAPVAVDMPIGLPDSGRRAADVLARAWLTEHGGPVSSVFLAPTRAVLDDWRAGWSHTDAMRRAAGRGEPGTSIQMWQLLGKVAEVDRVRDRVIEAHPECSFRAMGSPIDAPKKSARGAGQRVAALAQWYDVVPALADIPAGPGIDDALDAVAVAWTADRYAAGTAASLGNSDSAIWV
jgi:predicted RNase H-like nuclease